MFAQLLLSAALLGGQTVDVSGVAAAARILGECVGQAAIPLLRTKMSNEAIADSAIRSCRAAELREQAETRKALLPFRNPADPRVFDQMLREATARNRASLRTRLLGEIAKRRR
jgi:hypothetical protein